MDDRRQRREARIKQQQQKAAGCFALIALAVALVVGFTIFRTLGFAELGTVWTTKLVENPHSASDFAMSGDYLTCISGPTRMGVDVSEHQGAVDWEQVRAAGFDFAFIRIGYRGYSVGQIHEDDRAAENLEAARAAGMEIGVYFYSQAINTAEAAEEARWCLDYLAGMGLELPVVYDWEYVSAEARTGGMDKETLTECAKTFCSTITQGGYQTMVYFNPHIGSDLLELKELQEYPWWLAMYTDTMDYPYKVDIWQYTETGSVPGIEGDVDIDLMFLYEE